MTLKRKVLEQLTKPEVIALGQAFDLRVPHSLSVGELRDVVAGSKRATLERLLTELTLDQLRRVCDGIEIARSGSKEDVIDRILDELPPSLGGPSDDGPAPPTRKRRVLAQLTKAQLLAIAQAFDLKAPASLNVDAVRDVVAASKRASLTRILPELTLEELRAICDGMELSRTGSKQEVIDRLVGEESVSGGGGEAVDPVERPVQPPPNAPPAPAASSKSKPAVPANPPQMWMSFPEVAPSAPVPQPPAAQPAGGPPATSTPASVPPDAQQAVVVDVEPRKPRLAWMGMERREMATAVPTQVVEIVWPGRAQNREGELPEIRHAGARDVSALPPNRLIWTNDNLVALQTLLDERDPVTREYRYRGKVDLVYIDPPFMVNNDFRADNSIDIDIDEEAEVQAKKEPSLVEILAYRDTWRQGLDSFLATLRARLHLLKELLAPTGGIFVHLDWHAVHYVKVLMDEIFGYESLINEIIWKRGFSHNDLSQGALHMGRVHDTILFYGRTPSIFISPVYCAYEADVVRKWYNNRDEKGRRFQYTAIVGPGGAAKGNPFYELLGHKKYWRYSKEKAEQLVAEGKIVQPSPGAVPRYKRYLDEMPGVPLQDFWTDISPVNSQAIEALGYPTQKPVELLERIIDLACPKDGLVLDCYSGSGTTAEAAERLGRRWIGIDNGKYGIHLARKRLIQLHGQPRPPEKTQFDYVECEHCKNIERKERSQKSPGQFQVQPFTVENMGVYQRAEAWQDFQTQRTRYRDEMIKVFGGEPATHSPLLHGKKGNAWVHIGPLDAPISSSQVWSIARAAQATSVKAVTILSADFDTLSGSEKEEIAERTGVAVTVRVIPSSAIDEVKRRLELQRKDPEAPVESMAIPAFYAPLSIVIDAQPSGRHVRLRLERCEVDIESFLASQRPALKIITDGMSEAAKKKAKAEHDRWADREKTLKKWLDKATTWKKFIDFWAVDWDYGRRTAPDGKPIFETQWQSFRTRRGKDEVDELTFVAEFKFDQPGRYRVAARVTDVFGNDGIATVNVEVR